MALVAAGWCPSSAGDWIRAVQQGNLGVHAHAGQEGGSPALLVDLNAFTVNKIV